MNAQIRDDRVVVEGDAKQRLYDSGGYGRPHDSGDSVDLSFVEAAYLLRQDKLDAVGDNGFHGFLRHAAGESKDFLPTHTVYADLRERGYYLQHQPGEAGIDVYPRGVKPSDGESERRVRVMTEHDEVDLGVAQGLYGVVDDDLDVTYLHLREWRKEGSVPPPRGTYEAEMANGRAVLHDTTLHHEAFYGSRQAERLVLSPREAGYLQEQGVIEGIDSGKEDPVYGELRDRGLCPRSGLKFGTTYRVYDEFIGKEDLGHAPYLVDETEGTVVVREVARAVRLAHGVRKTMVFAVKDRYVSAERYRP